MKLLSFLQRQLHKLPLGNNRGWEEQVLYGRWRVKYNKDGLRTHPMFYGTAKCYASLFDGKVEYIGTRLVDKKKETE